MVVEKEMGKEPVLGTVISKGLEIAYIDWQKNSRDLKNLIVLHPNGFCAGLFDPIAQSMCDQLRIVGIDLRGHGGSQKVTDESLLVNDLMAEDVLSVAEHLQIEEFSLLGVSLGGAVSIEVAALAPEKVNNLMLCEAIAMNYKSRQKRVTSYDAENPLAAGARRRRPIWNSREEVKESYGSRSPLNELAPEFLSAYVDWGFMERPDGQIQLACSPETEAVNFGSLERSGPISTFERLINVKATSHVLAGTRSNLGTELFEQQAKELGVSVKWIDGGHFFLFENLERGVSLICDCVV